MPEIWLICQLLSTFCKTRAHRADSSLLDFRTLVRTDHLLLLLLLLLIRQLTCLPIPFITRLSVFTFIITSYYCAEHAQLHKIAQLISAILITQRARSSTVVGFHFAAVWCISIWCSLLTGSFALNHQTQRHIYCCYQSCFAKGFLV